MINYIFGGMILLSVLFAIINGTGSELAQSVLTGAEESIELILTMAGMLMLWSGVMEVANQGGLAKVISKLLSPILNKIFKNVPKNSLAQKYISMNVSANLLGLGNAATPFGLSAMEQLHTLNNKKDIASDDMILFVVINTASIQLVPTMIASLRQKYGSEAPFEIILCVWITSFTALCVGLILAKVLRRN